MDDLLEEVGSNDEIVSRVVDSHVAKGGYARVPISVGLDPRVKGLALKVYIVLASALRYTGTVSVGIRLIAEKVGANVRHVHRAIRQLEEAGHVKVVPRDRGMRGCYILTASIFHEKQGKANIKAYSQENRLIQVAVSEEHPDWPPRFDE
jgi:DNA-binding MarR family transcriptional regulator